MPSDFEVQDQYAFVETEIVFGDYFARPHSVSLSDELVAMHGMYSSSGSIVMSDKCFELVARFVSYVALGNAVRTQSSTTASLPKSPSHHE